MRVDRVWAPTADLAPVLDEPSWRVSPPCGSADGAGAGRRDRRRSGAPTCGLCPVGWRASHVWRRSGDQEVQENGPEAGRGRHHAESAAAGGCDGIRSRSHRKGDRDLCVPDDAPWCRGCRRRGRLECRTRLRPAGPVPWARLRGPPGRVHPGRCGPGPGGRWGQPLGEAAQERGVGGPAQTRRGGAAGFPGAHRRRGHAEGRGDLLVGELPCPAQPGTDLGSGQGCSSVPAARVGRHGVLGRNLDRHDRMTTRQMVM